MPSQASWPSQNDAIDVFPVVLVIVKTIQTKATKEEFDQSRQSKRVIDTVLVIDSDSDILDRSDDVATVALQAIPAVHSNEFRHSHLLALQALKRSNLRGVALQESLKVVAGINNRFEGNCRNSLFYLFFMRLFLFDLFRKSKTKPTKRRKPKRQCNG